MHPSPRILNIENTNEQNSSLFLRDERYQSHASYHKNKDLQAYLLFMVVLHADLAMRREVWLSPLAETWSSFSHFLENGDGCNFFGVLAIGDFSVFIIFIFSIAHWCIPLLFFTLPFARFPEISKKFKNSQVLIGVVFVCIFSYFFRNVSLQEPWSF